MPLLGHFSEFSLPEILLLIGSKTGTLRLLDVPPHGIIDLDLSQGEIQGLHAGSEIFSEAAEIVQTLSRAMQMYVGVFEFHLQPVASVARAEVLTISHLALSLVLRFDELATNNHEICPAGHSHFLVEPPPDLWMDPVLAEFFEEAQPFLFSGATASALSLQLGHAEKLVQHHLSNLKLLGFVYVAEELSPSYLQADGEEQDSTDMTSEFVVVDDALQSLQNLSSQAYSASA